jgi:hypothetical protein
MRCPDCGLTVPDGTRLCRCGYAFKGSQAPPEAPSQQGNLAVTCPQCGRTKNRSATLCDCGYRLREASTILRPIQKPTVTVQKVRPMPPSAPLRVVVVPTKSIGVSIILTFLFGPLGMFYSTIHGAMVMILLSFVVGLATFGLGLFITWPISIIWGAIATSTYNQELLQGQRQY